MSTVDFEDLKRKIGEALEDGASLEDLGIGVDKIVINDDTPVREECTQEINGGITFGRILKWTVILGTFGLVGYYLGRKSILGIDKPLGEPLVVTEDNRFLEI